MSPVRHLKGKKMDRAKKKLSQHRDMSNGMKVLLCRDVENLGWLGDVVEVSDGYARNYLLPQQIGVVPTEANIKVLAEAKARAVAGRERSRQRLGRAAAAVDGAEAVIAAKANEQGHLFGSVTGRDIAENLRAQGFEVPDETVDPPAAGRIKQVGTHEITLKFAAEVVAKINVVVVPEGQEVGKTNEGG